jgi:predicted transcriptional regulator
VTVKKEKTEFLPLRIDKRLLAEVERIAEKEDRPRSWIVRKAIEEYVKRYSS